jgi:hypothetical protein
MIIEVDEYKKKVENYDANNSELVHSESGKLADAEFKKCLQSRKYKRIIFMAGGTASGKTEFAYSYLNKKDQLVYDGTFKNGFKQKTDKIKKYDKNKSAIKIVLIVPYNWQSALETFLSRKRKMSKDVFFSTHVKSLESVSKVLLETKYRVEIFASHLDLRPDNLKYRRLKIKTRKEKFTILIKLSEIMRGIARHNGFAID